MEHSASPADSGIHYKAPTQRWLGRRDMQLLLDRVVHKSGVVHNVPTLWHKYCYICVTRAPLDVTGALNGGEHSGWMEVLAGL